MAHKYEILDRHDRPYRQQPTIQIGDDLDADVAPTAPTAPAAGAHGHGHAGAGAGAGAGNGAAGGGAPAAQRPAVPMSVIATDVKRAADQARQAANRTHVALSDAKSSRSNRDPSAAAAAAATAAQSARAARQSVLAAMRAALQDPAGVIPPGYTSAQKDIDDALRAAMDSAKAAESDAADAQQAASATRAPAQS